MDIGTLIALMVTLAFIGESTVEYLLGRIERLKPHLCYVALAVGIALALVYQVDILTAFFGKAAVVPYVGEVLTGCIIGRGANFVHDFAAVYLTKAQPVVPTISAGGDVNVGSTAATGSVSG